MKLNRLELQNYRCYTQLDLNFDPHMTVLVGDNGSGKTAVLDSIAMLLGAYLRRLPHVKGTGISRQDLRMLGGSKKLAPALRGKLTVDVHQEAQSLKNNSSSLPGNFIHWSVSHLRDKSSRTRLQSNQMSLQSAGLKQLQQFVDSLIDAYNENVPFQLPVVAYYGTGRAVFSTPMRRRGFQKTFSRFDALKDALQPTTNFKRLIEWIHAKEHDELLMQRGQGSFHVHDPELECVRKAITRFFPEFQNPRTELRPLRFVVDRVRHGQVCDFDLNQLSDGYRTTLALVADLASRMAQANPPDPNHKGLSPLDLEAVVLIDELDLHLHPRWQAKIVSQLKNVFPNAQFIVTTHSPLIVRHMKEGQVYQLNTSADEASIQIKSLNHGNSESIADLFKTAFGSDLNAFTKDQIDLSRQKVIRQELLSLLNEQQETT